MITHLIIMVNLRKQISQARKAMFALLAKVTKLHLPIDISHVLHPSGISSGKSNIQQNNSINLGFVY